MLLVCLWLAAFPSLAQEQAYAMTFVSADGSRNTFLFSDSPLQTFAPGAIVITSGGVRVELPDSIGHVQTFGYAEEPTIVKAPTAESRFRLSRTAVEVVSTPGAAVHVYAADGSPVASGRCDGEGRATLSTAGLGQGTYIFKTNRTTFKFSKQ